MRRLKRLAASTIFTLLLTQTATGAIPLPLTGQADAVAEAQSTNLVVNGSFEDSPVFTSGQCASTHKGMTAQYVTGWDKAYTGVGPSPGNYNDQNHHADYADTRCVVYVGPPNYPVVTNTFTTAASDGNRLVGAWIGGGYAEYFQGSLSQALVPGQAYTMSFDILGEDLSALSQYLGSYAGQTLYMGIDFYETKQLFNGNFTTSLSASSNMVSVPAIVLSANYKTVTVQFTATNAARYFVVGAFAGMGGSPAYVTMDNFTMMQVGGSSSSVPSCVPFTGSLRNVAGLQSVKIGEMSQPVIAVTNNFPTFGVNDAKLVTDIPVEGGSANDFASPGSSEYYDFYYSNADGTLNANGSYITIDNWRYNNLSNSAVGNNIDGVELSFGNGQKVYAGLVASTRPGTGLSGEYANGKAENALGGFDNKVTYMGDQKSSFTVGFCQNDIPTSSSSSSSSIISQCPVNLRHANVILSSTGVPSRGNPANTLLGAPGGANDSVNFDNDGNTAGFVKVGFPAPIVNGPGADFVLSYEDPDEDFEVFVYDQNGNKASVGYIARKYPYNTKTVEQVELPFDISGTGFSSVVAVEVVNRESRSSVDDSEGPDIRGFTSVYCATNQGSSSSSFTPPSSSSSSVSSAPKPECSDGIDNGDPEDTLVDFFDPGCYTNGFYDPNDPSENDPKPECSDGVDNADPEDTLSDFNDPGCYTNGVYDPNDPSEVNTPASSAPSSSSSSAAPKPECSDGVDNADPEDSLADYFDLGCYTNGFYDPNDDDETNPKPECSDGIDNGDPEDTLADYFDIGCYTNGFYDPNDPSETNTPASSSSSSVISSSSSSAKPECSDGVDNGDPEDTLADYFDPGCYTNGQYDPNDPSEVDTPVSSSSSSSVVSSSSSSSSTPPECNDGLDNDGDGRVDYANGNGDYGCTSNDDPTESPNPQCSDGIDNGDPEDALADANDPGCHTDGNPGNPGSYDPKDNDEGNSVSSSSSSVVSSSSSSAAQVGCIDILKEVYDMYGNRLSVAPQFEFKLDGGASVVNNSVGLAKFENVSAGVHTITEIVHAGWEQFLVTPPNSQVYVYPGNGCAGIVFKNRQNPFASSVSSSSSSAPVSSSSSSSSSSTPPSSSSASIVSSSSSSVVSSSSSSSSVALTQCNDGVDNGDAEDSAADQQDPGCHTDGDPWDGDATYDPNDDDEKNPPVLSCSENDWVVMSFSEGLAKNTAVSDQYRMSGLMFSADNGGMVKIAETAVVGGGGNGNVLAVNSVGGNETTLKIQFVNPVNGNQAAVAASSIQLLVSDTNADPSPRVIVRTHALNGTVLATVDATNETGTVSFSGTTPVAYLTIEDNGADGFIIDDLRYGPINCSPASSSSSSSVTYSSSSSSSVVSSSSSLSSSSSSVWYSSSSSKSWGHWSSKSSSSKSWGWNSSAWSRSSSSRHWNWNGHDWGWDDEEGHRHYSDDEVNMESDVDVDTDCDILIQQNAQGENVDQDALGICEQNTTVNVNQNTGEQGDVNQQSGIDQPLNVADVGVKLASISKKGKTTFIPSSGASIPMVVIISVMSAGLVGTAVVGRRFWL